METAGFGLQSLVPCDSEEDLSDMLQRGRGSLGFTPGPLGKEAPTRLSSMFPFQVAVLNNHGELVQLLLDKGADASVKNEVRDSRALPSCPLEEKSHVGNAIFIVSSFSSAKAYWKWPECLTDRLGHSFRLPGLIS